jgi:hypothetical protein
MLIQCPTNHEFWTKIVGKLSYWAICHWAIQHKNEGTRANNSSYLLITHSSCSILRICYMVALIPDSVKCHWTKSSNHDCAQVTETRPTFGDWSTKEMHSKSSGNDVDYMKSKNQSKQKAWLIPWLRYNLLELEIQTYLGVAEIQGIQLLTMET